MEYVRAFAVGGAICVVGQLLIDLTKLTPARIMVAYVTGGVILGALGWYAPLVNFAGCGATVPLSGFGYLLSEGVKAAVKEKGILGVFTGGITAGAAGIAAAVFFSCLMAAIAKPKDLAGLRIAVTAGPTQEPLDPVRYLTNHSTGKMGYAVARAAVMRGAEVTLIHGPTALQPVRFTEDVPITTAQQMYEAVTSRFDEMDVLVMAAAVADYRPAAVADDKIKKKDGDLSIAVERTPDILGTIGPKKKGQFLCGFSMETRDMLANSSAKLEKKNLDMVVANNLKVAGAGFGVDTNVVTFITPDGARELPLMSKDDVADAILDEILARKSK